MSASVEIVNTDIYRPFTNVVTDDLAIYTSTSNQSINIGTVTGTLSALRINNSNVEFNRDMTFVNSTTLSGLRVDKRTVALGTLTNISGATLSNTTGMSASPSNVTFSLNASQSNFQFTNSNNSETAIIDGQGNLILNGSLDAKNTGFFRNRLLNGDMRIAQRGTSAVSGTGANVVTYIIDQWSMRSSITTGGITQSQLTLTSSDTPFTIGFKTAWRVLASTACTNYLFILPNQCIEGHNISDLNWGTAFGASASISFWFRTNSANGSVIALSVRNADSTYSYVVPVTVASSGAWQYVSTTIPPPPAGSVWNTTTGIGIQFSIGAYGSTYLTSTSNSWLNGNFLSMSSGVNGYQTVNYYIDTTGVQFERGTVVTPFEFRSYALELDLCQRYYEVLLAPRSTTIPAYFMGSYTGVGTIIWLTFRTQKRVAPTLVSGGFTQNMGTLSAPVTTDNEIVWRITSNGQYYVSIIQNTAIAVSAEL